MSCRKNCAILSKALTTRRLLLKSTVTFTKFYPTFHWALVTFHWFSMHLWGVAIWRVLYKLWLTDWTPLYECNFGQTLLVGLGNEGSSFDWPPARSLTRTFRVFGLWVGFALNLALLSYNLGFSTVRNSFWGFELANSPMHPPSYAKAKKMMSLTLHAHGFFSSLLNNRQLLFLLFISSGDPCDLLFSCLSVFFEPMGTISPFHTMQYNTAVFQSFIPDISIAPLQVLYYSGMLPAAALILHWS